MKRTLLLMFLVAALFPVVNYYMISASGENVIFSNIASLPEYRNVLVFGAGMNYPSHHPNLSFNSRLDAAEKTAQLPYVERIILTGSVSLEENEAREMKSRLIERGIDEHKLIIDQEGCNTFQSLKNYKKQFGSSPVILISEQRHLERAVFYARHLNISCCGYATVYSSSGFTRELMARMKALKEIFD